MLSNLFFLNFPFWLMAYLPSCRSKGLRNHLKFLLLLYSTVKIDTRSCWFYLLNVSTLAHFLFGLEQISPYLSHLQFCIYFVHSSHCSSDDTLNLTKLVPCVNYFRVKFKFPPDLVPAHFQGQLSVTIHCTSSMLSIPLVRMSNPGYRAQASLALFLELSIMSGLEREIHKCLWYWMEMNKTYFCLGVLSTTIVQHSEECSL